MIQPRKQEKDYRESLYCFLRMTSVVRISLKVQYTKTTLSFEGEKRLIVAKIRRQLRIRMLNYCM